MATNYPKSPTQTPYATYAALLEPPKPILLIPTDVYGEMLGLCARSRGEIRSWGAVRQAEKTANGTSVFCLSGLIVPKQKVTGATVDVEEDDVNLMVIEAERRGISAKELRFVFHSHVDLEPFWSSTDVGDVKATGTGIVETPWIINMVMNRAGKYLCRFDTYTPMWMMTSMEVKFVPATGILAGIDQVIDERVSYSVPKYPAKPVKKHKGKMPRSVPVGYENARYDYDYLDEEVGPYAQNRLWRPDETV